MTRSVQVLCTPAVAAGFRLAGLRPIEVADASEGARRLTTLLDDATVAVVLVEDGIHAALPAELSRRLAREPLPIVVPLPGPGWDTPRGPETVIAELLRQAIGYRVKFE